MDDIREYGAEGAEQLSVVVIGFETDYVTRGKSTVLEPRDKVILGKIGDAQYRQEHWISRLSGERCEAPVIWAMVQPHYEAWKRGEEIVEEGTPLSATSFIPPKGVQAYRLLGVRTVEVLAKVEDGQLERMPLDARKHRDMARKWLEVANSETAQLAKRSKEQDDEIAALKAQVAELTAAAKPEKTPAKKAA